jgi:ATP-dependent Lon protease
MSKFLSEQVVLPVAPLKEGVLFPGMETRMIFTRSVSKMALRSSSRSQRMIFVTGQKNVDVEQPRVADLFPVGVVAKVGQIEEQKGNLAVSITALYRAKVVNWHTVGRMITAQVVMLEDEYDQPREKLEVMRSHMLNAFARLISMGMVDQGNEFVGFLRTLPPGQTCDHVANMLTANSQIKQRILETMPVSERIKLTLSQVETELQVVKVETDVIKKTHEKFEKHMRESVLRERLAMIQKELGDTDDEEVAADEYASKLKKLVTSKENKGKIAKELKRFRQTSSMSPESGYLRSWLDTVFELPWGKYSRDVLDLGKAEKILQESHYGLQEVKDRVLEYMAVLQLRAEQKKDAKAPTILCFVGPPGVGKTSIGQSIAAALGRKFAKISLGGVRDEAEIRGHRRTYVGAMAGRVVNGLKQAGTSNPVFMLDEIDKLAGDYHGDPASALLEVLDPEQNQQFEDHYLDMPFDLSKVIFIATANTLDIPSPLLDRMEVIRYAGYTVSEKMMIAKKYLWPRALSESGVKKTQVKLSDAILQTVIENYTKEAGVRELSRHLDKILRKVARQLLENKVDKKVVLTQKLLVEYLGPQKFDVSVQNQASEVGVATGLAWTSVGGDVLFVEVATAKGKGTLLLTGQLGEVMRESAQAAMTFVRSNADALKIDVKKLDKTDVHIHVPEGAVPKDGPSAGVTMVTALVSALTGKPIRKEVAMTGEVTLRGKVLRIGGLKEKAIAAARAGCKTVCIPWENQRDLVEIPEEIKQQIKFAPTKTVLENLRWALADPVVK